MTDPSHAASADDDPSSRRDTLFDWLKHKWRRGNNTTLRRSLEDAIEEHEDAIARTGDIGDEELAMLRNLLSNGSLRIDDIMVPRADIIAFDIDADFDALVALFIDAAHSRLPVYRESLDEVIGMVHIKDVVQLLAQASHGRPEADAAGPEGGDAQGRSARPSVASLLRSVLFVPPSMRVIDLLVKMRTSRTHMAVVIDEYGGTDGLVTIEDLIEQFVGDIEDEHDIHEPDPLRRLSDGGYDADARVAVEDLAAAMGPSLFSGEREDEVDTLGGLVVSLAGRVPMIGEIIDHPSGLRFEIVDGDPRRLKRVRIYPPPAPILEEDG